LANTQRLVVTENFQVQNNTQKSLRNGGVGKVAGRNALPGASSQGSSP